MNTEEQKKKIADEISDHYKEIDKLNNQLNDIYLTEAGDFTGSYVKYLDGSDNYRFIRVDNQTICHATHCLLLSGPMLSIDVDPLDDDFTDYDIAAVSYQDYADIYVPSFAFKEGSIASLTRIDKEDFELAVERCLGSMRNNIFDIEYPGGQ